MAFDARAFFFRFAKALDAQDYETVESMTHPDFAADMPQSGERIRGMEAWARQFSAYPNNDQIVTETDDAKIFGEEDRWAISPAYTVVPLAASNTFTTTFRTRYPDGVWWHIITYVELRDEKMYRMQIFFAPEMPAPLAQSIAAFGAAASRAEAGTAQS
jgi:hypothetical protein